MTYENPFAMKIKPLASSDLLVNTSNWVFSDWGICTIISAHHGESVCVEFEILDNWHCSSPSKILFKSCDWEEVQKWIKEHESEIKQQLTKNAIEWVRKYDPKKAEEFEKNPQI